MSAALATPLDVISSYPPHVGTLSSLLASRARAAPSRELIVFEGRSFSYAEVARAVARAAAMYASRGVQAGDRVGVMSRNHWTTVVTLIALAKLGATMVPVNPEFKTAEARYELEHAQVRGVLCSPEALSIVREACAGMSPPPWLLLNAPADGGIDAFDDALAATTGAGDGDASADSVCVFIYTSGTTGFPKGVMHCQRSMVMAGEGFVQRMYLQPDDRLLCIQPMFHINALFYSLCGALAAGATLILLPRFSATTFWATAAATGATETNTVAAISNILMRRPRSEFVASHSLRKIYGGPFNDEVYRVFRDEFGVATMIEGYAMSEIPGALSNPFVGPHKVGSMGTPCVHPDPQVALTQLRIVDDEFRDVPNGRHGQLVVRTPLAMKGYHRAPEQTASAFRDGWFLTGDLGWRDDDGYHWFVARMKDIIRKRGENISGAEIDRVIESHPDVLQAAAIPVPDDLGEDEILVAVLPKAGATISAETVAAWCRERLAAIKVPRYVAIVDALPCTPTHRVEKFRLRADASLKARAVDLGAKAATRG